MTPGEILGRSGVLEVSRLCVIKERSVILVSPVWGDPAALHEVVDSGAFDSFQAYYNLLNPSAGYAVPPGFSALDYKLLIDGAAAQGMGVAIMRVLAAGALTSNPAPAVAVPLSRCPKDRNTRLMYSGPKS